MDMGVLGRFEPSLEAVKIPRCPSCGAANPKAECVCPGCGAPAETSVEVRVARAALTDMARLFPWHARVLLTIGAWLKRLALQLKGG
jgi:predicted amidophosphoribosyltransferase